jgi:integrase
MASIYLRKNKIYISWYDILKQQSCSRATGLDNTPENIKIAEDMASKIQNKLDEVKSDISVLGIQRNTLEKAFKHFKRNNSDKHPKTIADYDRFFNKFSEKFKPSLPTTALNKLNIEEWLFEIKQLNYALNTIYGYYKQLNHFLNFLFEYDYVPMFKINKDIKPKREVKEKIVFEKEHIIKVFNSLDDPQNRKSTMFKTLVYLAFYTGLRSSDLMTLTVEKIDLEKREIKYYSPKRKIYRSVAFHSDLVPILTARINEVGTGKILNYSETEAIGKALRRYFKKLEIDENGYSARTFRKTFITLARGYNMNASVVAELVGHEHQSTADKFYNRIDHKTMIKELKKFKRPSK